MPNDFNQEFQTHLCEVVATLESQSQVEIVVIIRDRAENYVDIPLWWGIGGAFLAHSYLMFAPEFFYDVVIYFGPVVAFIGCWLLAKLPALQRLSLSRARKQKSVERLARALFQKGGIHHTQAKIGVLIYCSLLEQHSFVVADRGAELAIPAAEWQDMQQQLQQIYHSDTPGSTLLTTLSAMQPIFSRYLPPVAQDINELPDNLEINL